MDYCPDTLPISHYEYQLEKNQIRDLLDLRERAYAAMAQMEGWCSNKKACLLMDLILAIRPEIIVEIGVFGGKSVVPMAYALQYNRKGKIYGIDPWSSACSAEGMDGVNFEWWSAVEHEKIYQRLQHQIDEFDLRDQIELIRATSEACPPIPNIDILHIDGNHSEKASYLDVTKWVPLVRSGGIIIFDDVNWETTRAATEWLHESCIYVGEVMGDNIWGIWLKP